MSDVTAIQNLVQKRIELKKEISKIIVGQDEVVDQILLSIFSGGHALLVGVPGLAKTLMVNTIAQALGLDFKRIQFTPDLMPSDILGSEILDENRQFKFLKGPIFSNIILADENTSCFVRSDAGTCSNYCGAQLQIVIALFRFGNAKSDRAGRNISLA
jgi:MoxR-like ATPase